jgi:aminomethyltransferase
MSVAAVAIAGIACYVTRSGYTGEDGYEISVPEADAEKLARRLLAEPEVAPAGLGARDTLRLEVCFHLYGNDLSRDRDPISAGLSWACALDTDFVGSEALRKVQSEGPKQKLVPFWIVGPGIPRQGNKVIRGGTEIGEVTSGTMSPSLDNGIGLAYIDAEFAEPGTEVEIDVRGKLRTAQIRKKPLYAAPK